MPLSAILKFCFYFDYYNHFLLKPKKFQRNVKTSSDHHINSCCLLKCDFNEIKYRIKVEATYLLFPVSHF